MYTKLAHIYDLIYPQIFDYKKQLQLADKVLKKYDCKKVLEVGCGTGRLAKLLKNYDYTGSDLYSEMLKIARKRNPGVKFFKADMRALKTKEKYDAVIILGRSFTYMTTNEDVERALKSAHKVLKKGGILIFDNFDAKEGLLNYDKYLKGSQTFKVKGMTIKRKYENPWILDVGITKWMKFTWDIDGKIYKEKSKFRLFFKEELELFLEWNGFKVEKFYPRDFAFVAKA